MDTAAPAPSTAAPAQPAPVTAPAAPPAPPQLSWGSRQYNDPKGRIFGLDIARGLAIMGMFTAHLSSMGAGTLPAWLEPIVSLVNGRSAILFALLAGVSIGILSGRETPYAGVRLLQSRIRIFTRAVLLVAVVSVVAIFNSGIALILTYYAGWFVLSLPFLRCRARTLLIWAGALVILGPWAGRLIGALVNSLLLVTLGFRGVGYGVDQLAYEILFGGTYSGMVYMAFIFVGMALCRLGITRREVRRRAALAAAISMVLGYGISTIALTVQAGKTTYDFMDMYAASSPAEEAPSGSSLGLDSGPAEGSNSLRKDTPFETKFPDDIPALAGQPIPPECFCDFQDYDKMDDSGEYQLPSVGEAWSQLGEELGAMLLDNPFTASPHSNTTFEALGSGGFGVLIIILMVSMPRPVLLALTPIGALGSMSLTAYSLHVPVVSLAMANNADGYLVLGIMIVVMLAAATLWWRYLGRGPLEKLLYTVSWKAARVTTPARGETDTVPGTPPADTPAPASSAGE